MLPHLRMLARLASSPTIRLVLAVPAGCAVGYFLGENAAPLGAVGNVLIQAVKLLASPLLFVAVLEAVFKSDVRLRDCRRLATLIIANALAALVIAYAVSALLLGFVEPGALTQSQSTEPPLLLPGYGDLLANAVPKSLFH